MKHFLKLLDCTTEEIYELLDLAATMKQYVKEGKEHHFLKGKTLGMIFEKSSTRTRISFETGMYQLGWPCAVYQCKGFPDRQRRAHTGYCTRHEPYAGWHYDSYL